MRIRVFVVLLIIIILGSATTYILIERPSCIFKPAATETITSFEECAGAGYPIMESYPRQCRTAQGQNFVEDIGNELEKLDLIRIEQPRPNGEIFSPLIVKGQARGFWFFEADFPVKLYDSSGDLIALGMAQARSDWMTEDFVAFEAILEFQCSLTTKGALVLEKDNPSGLPEHMDQLIVPVRFIPGCY